MSTREFVAARIREARERSGLSQYRVAKKLGISQATWHGYENSLRSPSFDRLEEIADIFGKRVSWFLEEPSGSKEGVVRFEVKNEELARKIQQFAEMLGLSKHLSECQFLEFKSTKLLPPKKPASDFRNPVCELNIAVNR